MSGFNSSARKEDVSLRLRAQNLKNARDQTKRLEEDNRKMEERLRELKTAMNREKEERERQGGGFWGRGQQQIGSLTNYASEVLEKKAEKPPKEGKIKKVKVLQDENIELPKRSSQPGTMKYIAQRKLTTGATPRDKGKGPKCGQCEDRSATLSCVQCSEIYCPGCFAAFHLKGALKQHRSVPLSASGPRVCMSPRTPADSKSPRDSHASGTVPSQSNQRSRVNGSEASGPPTGSAPRGGSSPSLLDGAYDESESAASFQAALMAWRQGEQPSTQRTASPQKPIASPVKSPVVAIDEATGMTEQARVPEIKFKSTLSYAERLMLKKHRRTELAETSTPRLGSQSRESQRERSQSESPRSYLAGPNSQSCSSGSFTMLNSSRQPQNLGGRQESFIDDGEHVDFQSLFEAVVSSESPERLMMSSSSHSNTSIPDQFSTVFQPPPAKPSGLKSSSTYVVEEVSPLASWKVEHDTKSGASSSTFIIDDHHRSQPHEPKISSRPRVDTITEMYQSEIYTVGRSSALDTPSNQSLPGSESPDQKPLSSSRPKSRKQVHESPDQLFSEEGGDVPGIQTGSSPDQKPAKPQGRPKSSKSRSVSARGKGEKTSRAASCLRSAGHLTKGPSAALSEIANLAHSPGFVHTYHSPMEGFFLVGVEGEKPEPQEDRVITPSKSQRSEGRPKSRAEALKSARGERESIKVSNRLYQMAPRSWRPDSSLGETVSIHEVKPEEEWTASYSYSGQMVGKGTEWQPAASLTRVETPTNDAAHNPLLVFGDEMFVDQVAATPTPRAASGRRSNTSVLKSQAKIQRSLEIGQGDSRSFETSQYDDNVTPTPSTAPRRKSAGRRSQDVSTPSASTSFTGSARSPVPLASSKADSPAPVRSRRLPDLERSATNQSMLSSIDSGSGKSQTTKDAENLKLSRQTTGSPRPPLSAKNIPTSRPGSNQPKPEQIQPTPSIKSGMPITKDVKAASRGAPNPNSLLPNKGMAAPRQSSYVANKEARKALTRQESDDATLNQRPISSTNLSFNTQDKRPPSAGKSRPRSSTGGIEPVRGTQPSLRSADAQGRGDTIVQDMMMSRLQEDGWMDRDDDGGENEVSMDYDDGDDITPASIRSRQVKMLQRSTKQNKDHWETEVRPFSGISMTSQIGELLDTDRSSRQDNRKRRPLSSRPTSIMSHQSGRESRAIVMEGEDLSRYDNVDVPQEQEMEDKQTLDQLEWELASDTGRLTADGQISRMGNSDDEAQSSASSRSSARSLRMSADKDFDLDGKLQEDERQAQQDVDDFDMRRSVTLDEDEVRALR